MTASKRGAERRDKTMAKAKLEVQAARLGGPIPAQPAKPKAKPRHIEDDHQAAYFRWVDQKAKQDTNYGYIYAVPNGGKRIGYEAKRLQEQGVRAGVLDINIDVKRTEYTGSFAKFVPGMRIEMKRPIVKGERDPKISEEQVIWLTRYKAMGFITCVCYGWDQAREATEAYLSGKADIPHQWEPAP